MTIWWKTDKYDIDITPVEVIKETPQKLRYVSEWMGHKREDTAAKFSEYHNFYPTFEEARTALIERSKRQIQNAEETIKTCSAEIAKLSALTDPSLITGGTQ